MFLTKILRFWIAVFLSLTTLLSSCVHTNREFQEWELAESKKRADEAEKKEKAIRDEISARNASEYKRVVQKWKGTKGVAINDRIEIVSDSRNGDVYSGDVLVRWSRPDRSMSFYVADAATVTKRGILLRGFRQAMNPDGQKSYVRSGELDGQATFYFDETYRIEGSGKITLPIKRG